MPFCFVLAPIIVFELWITNVCLKAILWALHIIQSMIELYNLIVFEMYLFSYFKLAYSIKMVPIQLYFCIFVTKTNMHFNKLVWHDLRNSSAIIHTFYIPSITHSMLYIIWYLRFIRMDAVGAFIAWFV